MARPGAVPAMRPLPHPCMGQGSTDGRENTPSVTESPCVIVFALYSTRDRRKAAACLLLTRYSAS